MKLSVRLCACAAAVIALASCAPEEKAAPAATPASVPAEAPAAPTPPESMAGSFTGCVWGEVRGAGVSMWRYDCPDRGPKLVADTALPGISNEYTDPETQTLKRAPVVRLFDIAEGAAIDSILPAVRAASPAPGNEECVFVATDEGPQVFELRPTGTLMASYQLFLDSKADGPVLPCGELGPSEAGQRVFFPLPGSKTKIAAVSFPSDIAAFDWKTLRAE